MYEQNQIASTLASADGINRLQDLLAQAGSASRTEMGRRVCQAFGFQDARGRPQLAGCMKALRTLDAHGRIQLPAPRHERRRCRPRGLGRPVPAPADVPARADLVQGLALVAVTDDDQRRVWNELLQREHPRGAARHVGAQLRYLLVSDHGVLGALGFAASALTLAARDAFIGWDADRRSRQLHRVIALSRFLIRPCVDCRNLASKALGLCLRRLPDDFQRRYGYRPLLVETFVAKDRHAGTSLAAANWLRVGETAGRGRFAASGTRVPVKVVYLYPLARDWRAQLGVAEPPEPPALGPGEGLARDAWAAHEFGSAPLGDVRWSKRLVQSAQIQSEAPTKSFLGAAQKDRAAVKGHYRLIDQPADSQITPQNILAPHRQRTLRRMQGQAALLCIQDGTDLNFAAHGGCVGLGQIGKNSNAQGTLGLHMHSTLAVQSRQDAERVLEWYRLRWRIEDWHRVLKTGCKVEYLAHRTGERIERAVTINAVIAWRLMAMTLLGRDTPELPAETLFSDIEIAALEDFAQDRKLPPPDNIGRAVLTTAMLGGYLGFKRKRYAGPGHQVLWEGYTRLATIVQACERSLRLDQDSKLHLRLRKNKTYG